MPPMNGSGSRKPSSARLGMVCATLADSEDEPAQRGAAARRRSRPECRSRSPRCGRDEHQHQVLLQEPQQLGCACDVQKRTQAHQRHVRGRGPAAAAVDQRPDTRDPSRPRPAPACRRAISSPASSTPTRCAERERLGHVVGDDDDGRLELLLDAARTRARTSARVTGSSAPNGSSISRIGGSTASARATPTRWRWPPDSSCGRRAA